MPKKLGASLFPMAVVFVVALMVIPIPTVVLDVLLAFNLGLAILMLLASLNVSKALDLASFPSLLLIATLFRLGLNVSTARLILSEGDAGEVIKAFGSFVIGGSLVVGLVVFFILEKLVLLRHCHTDDCHVHGAAAQLVIFGDAFHNFIDGAIIAAAVLTSVPLGVNAAIAIAAHEIPQEVGDIAILLHSGYSRRKALILNIASGAAGIAGALFGYGMVSVLPHIRPFVIAFSSASMLYIAMSDLIPDLHRGSVDKNSLRQVLLIAAGIGTVVVLGYFGAA